MFHYDSQPMPRPYTTGYNDSLYPPQAPTLCQLGVPSQPTPGPLHAPATHAAK
ncbi:hypothetical protein DPMN_047983 [Dreissena polymorpha]|uniref:Uncharacterized protein n=1 Tax=Dreissena polymorpha TaxID=45954 RepID=A0A9D4DBE7_DREPO|nr:hypothetical protein DPMN_047983 [Dreissena polymorpha]